MLLIGLTGNIASGKSVAAQMFSERGATIVDADVLARRVVEPGTPTLTRIGERWGQAILNADGTLNRAELRHRVFSDAAQLEILNGIVHPAVAELREQLVAEARRRGDRIVICDIPLLFERRLVDEFDHIVLIDAPRPVRLERLVRERGISETEAMAMIAAQMPAQLKRARADVIIDNAGSLAQLEEEVSTVWAAFEREASADAGAAIP